MIIRRLLYKKIEPYLNSPEAIVVTGMRRVGKTTLLKDIFEGIETKNKTFLDLENPLNQKYFEEDNFEKIKRIFEFLGLNFKERIYIFLDEIQLAPKTPQVVKYFVDHYQVKFFLTGSASLYLKNLFSESLSGRKYVFELFPLTFQEFLEFKKPSFVVPAEHSQLNQPMIQTLLECYHEYLEFGGFPQVVLKQSTNEKRQSLQDIFSSYFQLEVERLSDFRKTNKLRDLILLLVQRIGTKLDVNKLATILSIARQSVYDYLAFLEGTYFIKLIKPFTTNRDVEIKKAPKIYVCDCGLAKVISHSSTEALFEQSVFQNLRQKGEVSFYQKKSGAEIDFVLDKKYLYDVKMTPGKTDYSNLARLSDELGLESHQIVSLNYSEVEHVIYGFEV